MFLPLAEHRAVEGDFEGARKAYQHAGRPDLASVLLRVLLDNSIAMDEQQQAAQLSWRLADAELAVASGAPVARSKAGQGQRDGAGVSKSLMGVGSTSPEALDEEEEKEEDEVESRYGAALGP